MFTTKNHNEINNIDNQRKWFNGTTILVIIVSFVHMLYSIQAFSGTSWYEQFAAMFITGTIDLATWRLSEYIVYEMGKDKKVSIWAKGLFIFALVISFILNFTYLTIHIPKELPYYVALFFATLLAGFVPAVIGIVPMISAKLKLDAQEIIADVEDSKDEIVSDLEAKKTLIRSLIEQGLSNNKIYAIVKGSKIKTNNLINELRDEMNGAL